MISMFDSEVRSKEEMNKSKGRRKEKKVEWFRRKIRLESVQKIYGRIYGVV